MKRHRAMTSERGVSEVIAVLLMVAVTIVLAAMVGSVLLDIVSDIEENPLAGASVKFDGKDEEIRAIFMSTQESGTTLEVRALDSSGDEVEIKTISDVGESKTFNATELQCPGSPPDCNGQEYTVRVIATAQNGKQAVVLQKDGTL